jgi:hypothetical protein
LRSTNRSFLDHRPPLTSPGDDVQRVFEFPRSRIQTKRRLVARKKLQTKSRILFEFWVGVAGFLLSATLGREKGP